MPSFNIDSKTISKQITATKLKQKVIVTSAVLLVVVIAWFIIDYTTRRESTIDESFTVLAEPFRFNINQEVLSSLDLKDRYSDEELTAFPIYIVDENALARGNSLVVNELGAPAAAETNFIDDSAAAEGAGAGAASDLPAADQLPVDAPPPPSTDQLPENLQTDTGGADTTLVF